MVNAAVVSCECLALLSLGRASSPPRHAHPRAAWWAGPAEAGIPVIEEQGHPDPLSSPAHASTLHHHIRRCDTPPRTAPPAPPPAAPLTPRLFFLMDERIVARHAQRSTVRMAAGRWLACLLAADLWRTISE